MRVFVSCCSYKGPKFASLVTILKMLDYADECGVTCMLMPRGGESLICRARNRALADFWYQGYDYLMTIDDDLMLPQDTIIKLINADKPVVGGFYRLKTNEYAGVAVRVSHGNDWLSTLQEEKIVEADYISTGCMLVKREVVMDMINKYPELEYMENLTSRRLWAFYQPFVHNNGEFKEYLSEDWAFCERAKMAGHSIWAHGGVKCGHWGETLYTLEMKEEEDARMDS